MFVGDGPLKSTSERIVHAGIQPNTEIPRFIALADLLVLPSHHEGLGQVILEAGAGGLPVVGSSTGGITNLLSRKRGWLFPPGDIEALTRRLREVHRSPEEARRRGKRLKQHVLNNHVLSDNANRLIAAYRSLYSL